MIDLVLLCKRHDLSATNGMIIYLHVISLIHSDLLTFLSMETRHGMELHDLSVRHDGSITAGGCQLDNIRWNWIHEWSSIFREE